MMAVQNPTRESWQQKLAIAMDRSSGRLRAVR